jgi:hypothetical protein
MDITVVVLALCPAAALGAALAQDRFRLNRLLLNATCG